jgi:hypothetical protein
MAESAPTDTLVRICPECDQLKSHTEYLPITSPVKNPNYDICKPCRRERTGKIMFGMSLTDANSIWAKQRHQCAQCHVLMREPMLLSAAWLDYSQRAEGIICRACMTPEEKLQSKRALQALKKDNALRLRRRARSCK